MKRFLLLTAITFCFQFSFSQIPNGYYDSATGSGYTLKTQLHNIIDDHTSVSYSPGVWNAFYTTDVRSDGYVWDTYSNCNFTLGDDQDSGSGGTAECQYYNREHSFPRNWFGGEVEPMNTDLFHIMPTDKYVNGRRGNLEYGEVANPSEIFNNGSKIGENTYGSFTGTVFEPIDDYKGDFARNYFYMVTRYEDIISAWPGSNMLDGSSDQCFTEWALNMLIEWHNADPVSQKEIDRNAAIYNIQNNRNPFIDHPEYVAQIWGGTGVFISDVQHSPVSPKSSDVVTVTATITSAGGTITSANLKWGTATGNYTNTVTMSSSKGSYTGNIPAQTDGTTVYYVIEATDDNAQSATSSEYDYLVSDHVTTTIFEEDFETSTAESPISINGWTRYEESGTYTWVGKDYNSNKYAQMTAYGTGQTSNISWLITPEIDLSNISEATLNFMSKDGYNNGDPVEVFISTDFVGTGNPNAANWTNLNPTLATGSTGGYAASFTESGDVDLTSYCGNTVYIAYKYSGGDPSLTTTMQIDDIVITGTQTMNVAPEISEIENLPISPTEGDDVTVSAKITDSDGTVATAEIKWGTTAGSYTNTVSMTENADDYSGIIPSQSGGTTVFYVIEATDNDNGSTRSTEMSFSFNTPGNAVPEITNVAFTPEVPESDEEAVVNATIADADGTIDIAQIKWGTSTGNYSNTINLSKSSGDDYSASIPAQVEGTEIYFVIYAVDEDGGSTQSTEQSYAVNYIPEISNIDFIPTTPESTENVTISANIEDNDGTINVAQIKWGTFSGSYTNTETMENSSGSYSGEIPAQNDNTTIYFVVYAEDNNGAAIESSEQSYTVDDPNVLPEITNIVIDPADPESTEDVRVSATIIDSDGRVETATLKWGTSAGNYTTNIGMSGTGDSYLGTIPSQADGTEVFFVIVAEDDEAATTTSSEQSYRVDDQVNEAPLISEVAYEPTNPTPTDNVVVSCNADDTDGSVASVLLQWKVGSSAYTDVNMNLSGGKYYGQIPQQASGATVDFNIIAEDNEGLQATYDDSYLVSEASGLVDINEQSIRVYPNPAKEFITVQIDNYNQQLELVVYDVIGSQVYREQVDFNVQHRISVDDLESGLYFISFAIDKSLVTKKILIKK